MKHTPAGVHRVATRNASGSTNDNDDTFANLNDLGLEVLFVSEASIAAVSAAASVARRDAVIGLTAFDGNAEAAVLALTGQGVGFLATAVAAGPTVPPAAAATTTRPAVAHSYENDWVPLAPAEAATRSAVAHRYENDWVPLAQADPTEVVRTPANEDEMYGTVGVTFALCKICFDADKNRRLYVAPPSSLFSTSKLAPPALSLSVPA